MARQPEISDLHCAPTGHKNVSSLNVPMDDVLGVKVLHPQENLVYDALDVRQLEFYLWVVH